VASFPFVTTTMADVELPAVCRVPGVECRVDIDTTVVDLQVVVCVVSCLFYLAIIVMWVQTGHIMLMPSVAAVNRWIARFWRVWAAMWQWFEVPRRGRGVVMLTVFGVEFYIRCIGTRFDSGDTMFDVLVSSLYTSALATIAMSGILCIVQTVLGRLVHGEWFVDHTARTVLFLPLVVVEPKPKVYHTCIVCDNNRVGAYCPTCRKQWVCRQCQEEWTFHNPENIIWPCCRTPRTTGSRVELTVLYAVSLFPQLRNHSYEYAVRHILGDRTMFDNAVGDRVEHVGTWLGNATGSHVGPLPTNVLY
jgi:hypothetical protein